MLGLKFMVHSSCLSVEVSPYWINQATPNRWLFSKIGHYRISMPDEKTKPQKIGLFHMLRDVLIASIDRGQFPIALFGLTMLTIIMRMPQEDLSKMAFQLLDKLSSWHYLGWGLAILFAAGWRIHLKLERRIKRAEVQRVSDERTKVQLQALGEQIVSSETRQGGS